jgi:hypothetical protein
MAVEFQAKDVSFRGKTQYKDGQLIPCVIFKTEVLPRGMPTTRFDPYLSSDGRYFLISVAVAVKHNKIVFYALSRGQAIRKDIPGYAISHALFRQGIAASIAHDGKDFPGLLRPLPQAS